MRDIFNKHFQYTCIGLKERINERKERIKVGKSAVQKSLFSSLARLPLNSEFRSNPTSKNPNPATQLWSIPTSGSGIKISIPSTLN